MKIYHSKQINLTPLGVTAVALCGNSELIQNQQFDSNGGVLLNYNYPVIWAQDRDETLGVIVYSYEEWRNQNFMNLAYVVPAWREKGIFSAMFQKLVEKTKDDKVLSIGWGTHIDNVIAQKVYQRFCPPSVLMYKLDIGELNGREL